MLIGKRNDGLKVPGTLEVPGTFFLRKSSRRVVTGYLVGVLFFIMGERQKMWGDMGKWRDGEECGQ